MTLLNHLLSILQIIKKVSTKYILILNVLITIIMASNVQNNLLNRTSPYDNSKLIYPNTGRSKSSIEPIESITKSDYRGSELKEDEEDLQRTTLNKNITRENSNTVASNLEYIQNRTNYSESLLDYSGRRSKEKDAQRTTLNKITRLKNSYTVASNLKYTQNRMNYSYLLLNYSGIRSKEKDPQRTTLNKNTRLENSNTLPSNLEYTQNRTNYSESLLDYSGMRRKKDGEQLIKTTAPLENRLRSKRKNILPRPRHPPNAPCQPCEDDDYVDPKSCMLNREGNYECGYGKNQRINEEHIKELGHGCVEVGDRIECCYRTGLSRGDKQKGKEAEPVSEGIRKPCGSRNV